MKFKIEDNLFDSGIIAPKVGNLVLEDCKNVHEGDGKLVRDCAREKKYSLITLGIETPVELDGFEHFGIIQEIEAKTDNVWKNVCNIPTKFNVRPIGDSDWEQVKELLYTYPPTRYSKDPNVTFEQVVMHKLSILKHLAKKYPKYAIGAFSKQDELIGFHFLRLTGADFLFLQELLVKPDYRVGFVSLQLVKENLSAVINDIGVKCLATRVYEDNNVSRNFFSKLGFLSLKKKEYYYHMWV